MPAFTPHVAPPSRAADAPPPGALRIAYGPAPQHFGDLRLPAAPARGPRPLIVIVHGGAYRNAYHLDLMDDLADDLARRGFATWNVEYRRMGDPGAEWPGLFQDVAAAADRAVALAAAHGLDLARVLTLGHSAGGHLALWLAGRHRIPAGSPLAPGAGALPVRAAVAIAPVTDLDRLRAARPELDPLIDPAGRSAIDPYALLPLGRPHAVVHGVEDQSVALAESRRYVDAARAAGDRACLVEVAGAEHFAPIRPDQPAWAHVAAAVQELARG
jgi:acetyl esterase/lipase